MMTVLLFYLLYSRSDRMKCTLKQYSRTETVVEKMLTNWMSICLYSFLKVSHHVMVQILTRKIYEVTFAGSFDWDEPNN